MSQICKNCGADQEQHDTYAQAIGAKEIYVWDLGISLPVVDCQKFERRVEKDEEKQP